MHASDCLSFLAATRSILHANSTHSRAGLACFTVWVLLTYYLPQKPAIRYCMQYNTDCNVSKQAAETLPFLDRLLQDFRGRIGTPGRYRATAGIHMLSYCYIAGLSWYLCRTGWSALYDDSTDEEEAQDLQGEPSQASSLSFQPHDLFKEHFATVPTTAPPATAQQNHLGQNPPPSPAAAAVAAAAALIPTAVADASSSPRAGAPPADRLCKDTAAASSTARDQHQGEMMGDGESQAKSSYTPKVRKSWGCKSGSGGTGTDLPDHDPLSVPEEPCHVTQSPGGKPPLPRTGAGGQTSFLPVPKTGQPPARVPRLRLGVLKSTGQGPSRELPGGSLAAPSALPASAPPVDLDAQLKEESTLATPLLILAVFGLLSQPHVASVPLPKKMCKALPALSAIQNVCLCYQSMS